MSKRNQTMILNAGAARGRLAVVASFQHDFVVVIAQPVPNLTWRGGEQRERE